MLLPLSEAEINNLQSNTDINNNSTSSLHDEKYTNKHTLHTNIKTLNPRIFTSRQVFRTFSTLPEYFHRIIDYRQMDIDATFYQMVTLCVYPSKVYKSAYYRKQTKNQWARDDPAFVVIQFIFLIVATFAWALAFHVHSVASYFGLLFHAIIVEYIGFGLILSTIHWWVANHFLRRHQTHGRNRDILFVDQHVEWQFAFDIHCNAFFILFLFLYVIQFFLAPILSSRTFISLVIGNLLYTLAWWFYVYITFLGYLALPFLHHTERFLLPSLAIITIFLCSILMQLIFGWTLNFAHLSIAYYYSI